jgi:phosphatidylglycerol:prolipoprotein diacylglycerol transferase
VIFISISLGLIYSKEMRSQQMYPLINVTIPSYGLFALIGGFFALVYIILHIDNNSFKIIELIKLFIISVAGIIIGGKLLYTLTQIPLLLKNFSILNLISLFMQSGIVYYGGLFGMIFGIGIYAKIAKLDLSSFYDLIAPSIPLFHGFGRIGCFLAGCCYGKELSRTYVVFRSIQVDRIPTQLIEALFEFILFIVLYIISKSNIKTSKLKIYLATYGIFRFTIEFFRGDVIRGIYIGLSTAQWISILILLYYIFKYLGKRKNIKVFTTK